MSTSASSSKIARHVSKVFLISFRFYPFSDNFPKKIFFPKKACHVDEQQLYLSERVWACAWHFSGNLIASAGEDKTIKVF